MNAGTNVLPEAAPAVTTTTRETRPFYWSVRRELWGNRSLFIAPLGVAAFGLVAIIIGLIRGSVEIPTEVMARLNTDQIRVGAMGVFWVLATITMVTMGIVAWFYCLDALNSERRDRSVLFWKSLPVSDLTTVLSKFFTATIVVAVIGSVIVLAWYLVAALLASVFVGFNGGSGLAVLANAEFLELAVCAIYTSLVSTLWFAPVHGWLLFVSSWARRATFLWALLPPAALAIAENVAFGTRHLWRTLGERWSGMFIYAFTRPPELSGNVQPRDMPEHILSILDPIKFLSQPGLWVGLGGFRGRERLDAPLPRAALSLVAVERLIGVNGLVARGSGQS
jgi:ABC-2 type transport system permease protein